MGEKHNNREAFERTVQRIVENSNTPEKQARKDAGAAARIGDAQQAANPPRSENKGAQEQARKGVQHVVAKIPVTERKKWI